MKKKRIKKKERKKKREIKKKEHNKKKKRKREAHHSLCIFTHVTFPLATVRPLSCCVFWRACLPWLPCPAPLPGVYQVHSASTWLAVRCFLRLYHFVFPLCLMCLVILTACLYYCINSHYRLTYFRCLHGRSSIRFWFVDVHIANTCVYVHS